MEVDLSTSRHGCFAPRKQPPVPIRYEAGWASEPLWTLWGREEYLAVSGNRTPVVQPVTHSNHRWNVLMPSIVPACVYFLTYRGLGVKSLRTITVGSRVVNASLLASSDLLTVEKLDRQLVEHKSLVAETEIIATAGNRTLIFLSFDSLTPVTFLII
jgi:hypothetical protein